MSESYIRFVNVRGYEYKIGLKEGEIVIDTGEGGLLTLEEYYAYANAGRERAWFEAMGGEIRQSIAESVEHPEYDYEIRIEPEDLAIPRTIEIIGYEMIEKRAAACGNSGRVYVPADWIGHRVAVIRLD